MNTHMHEPKDTPMRLFLIYTCIFLHVSLRAEAPKYPQWRVSAGVEASKGDSFWDMRFLFEEEPLGLMSGRSLLDWKDLEATSTWISLDITFTPVFGLSTRFAWGDIRDGNNTDTDWFGADPSRTADTPISQSIAETDGDLRSGSFDLWYRFRERPRHHVDLVLGLQWHQENLRDQNGITTFDLFEGNLYEPFDGLNSTFDFDWRAFRIGLRGEADLRENLVFSWRAISLVAVDYEGEGYWNLRDDFRAQAPQFEQSGDNGFGADLYAGLRWHFRPAWALEGGINWLRLRIRDGREITYFSDGTAADTEIREAQSTRTGISLGLSYSF